MAGKEKEAVKVAKARKALFSPPEMFHRNLENPGVQETLVEAAMESEWVICGADSPQSACSAEPVLTGE